MGDETAARWYSVRCLFRLRMGPSRTPRDDALIEYEERITIWRADSFETAIAMAEAEAHEYTLDIEVEYLGIAQAFALDEDVDSPTQGTEVFSLIRADDRPPQEYIDRYFDTGSEYQQTERYNHRRDPH